ncbi:MAG: hypothetical protein LH609_18925 [Rudanella sp.]|nr:hypothetical protein [Rudanella sp.]
MLLVLTVCPVRQLAQALTLGDALQQHHPDARFMIGLADEANPIRSLTLPHPILPVSETLDSQTLAALSERYTPTEFAAATKPGLVRAMMAQHPDCEQVIYLAPDAFIYQPLTAVLSELATAQMLLTPHLTAPPADGLFPDEKYLQNVGLYSADFLGLHQSEETERMLLWWENRVQTRAQVDFCESLCLDQIWLMHLPALFNGVRIIKDRRWHRAIWNWHEPLKKGEEPPLWVNFKGLYNQDEGLFVHQTRLKLTRYPALQQLLTEYRAGVTTRQQSAFEQAPAFGQQPEPPVVRGWKRQAALTLRSVATYVETVDVPAIH